MSNIHTDNTRFSFAKHKKYGEIHIFEGETDPEGCTAENRAICSPNVTRSDTEFTADICMEEQAARERAAKIGATVCGNCVRHLYKTPKAK